MRNPSSRRTSALITAAGLLFSACAPGEDMDEGPAVSTRESALSAAQMAWGPGSPDAALLLHPGDNSTGVTQSGASDINRAYRVAADGTLGISGGRVTVQGPAASDAASPAACAQQALSAHVWGFSLYPPQWVDLGAGDAVGKWESWGGEFPGSGCSLMLSYSVGAAITSLRVMAQARWALNTLTSPQVRNAAVSLVGRLPIPDPGKQVKIQSITFTPGGRQVNAVVANIKSGAIAQKIVAGLSGTYRYCDKDYCELSTAPQCDGYFCPPGILPPGNWSYPLPQPKICNIKPIVTAPRDIPAGGTVGYGPLPAAISTFTSDDCPPCTVASARCGGVDVTVRTYSQATLQPWEDWDRSSFGALWPGLVK